MKLIFLGDSLMQINKADTFPQTGWPQLISSYLVNDKEVQIEDYALNGRSTKSFIDEGQFAKALENASYGDVCFISFGHNDEKYEDPKRYTSPFDTYQRNLIFMENEMKKKGVTTVFLSSITRLKYDEKKKLKRTHGDYPKAMRDVAKLLVDPYVDLEQITYDDLSKNTYDYNKQFYMILPPHQFENYLEGKDDTTHLRKEGAEWICSLVVPELKKIPSLAPLFK